ncbi:MULTISPECIES: nucleoside recognition protein [unclassified Haladaptatus]|uniref:nucleoside recognition protein n=1 Tax=unclassified Haladaptatus TaxID=2622732 RepID=UPI0023E762D0|nr:MULTISPECIES: nucleoside recognition protein [unclassified Haladaptatus]
MQSLVDLLWVVGPRVAKITLFIAIGVFLANLAVAFGAVRKIAALSRPLTHPANLPEEVGTAILTTTASTTAGYGMLAEFRESGMLDDRATLVAVTINTFFGFAQHIFTFYAPVLIPILGLEVGLMYVGTRALIALAITLVGIAAGAFLLSSHNVNHEATPEDVEAPGHEATSTREKLEDAGQNTASKIRDIVPRLAIIYTLVVFLTTRYDIAAATAFADPLVAVVGLPIEAVPVIAVLTLDTTNGALVLAPLIENGTFTPRAAVATMLVGSIVSFAVTTFKRSIPFQYGIWGAEFGSKVIAVNTGLKLVFISLAVGILLAPIW